MFPKESEANGFFQGLRPASRNGLSDEDNQRLHAAETDLASTNAAILVVDDNENMRTVTSMALQKLGYGNIFEAADGEEALQLLRNRSFDLLVLDLEMPRLDGFGVLVVLKGDPKLRDVPVIIASGLDDMDAMVRCIELGADDFLPKPVKMAILKARVNSLLDRKRLRDLDRLRMQEMKYRQQLLEIAQEKSQRLLLNVLPASIADRLIKGEKTIAERFEHVTVLFADLVEFSDFVNRTDPRKVVDVLNDLFSRFDKLAINLGLEKIKTIGDGYLLVGGMPELREDHAVAVAKMALGMLEALAEMNGERELNLRMRIGLNSGPVVAGVIGKKKFAYDLWGVTVNLASRMQATGLPNKIHVPAHTRDLLEGKFRLTERGTVECKGVGVVHSFLLEGRKPA